jgi:hypothetical protein
MLSSILCTFRCGVAVPLHMLEFIDAFEVVE